MEHVLSTKDHFTGIITGDYSDISPVMEREDGKFYLVAYTSYVLQSTVLLLPKFERWWSLVVTSSETQGQLVGSIKCSW